jgi:hypothetical protein
VALFEKMRVSLDEAVEEAPLLEQAGYVEPSISRSDYLFRAFGEHRRFLKSETAYDFHPIEAPGGFVAGFFSRSRPLSARHADLSQYVAENYEPSLFVMAVNEGQIVWMEERSEVGSPKAILEAFFKHLIRKTDLKNYVAFVRYFERQQDFWEVVQTKRQEITKVTLKFVPPNAFEGKELAQEFYTALQREVDNDSLEQTLKAAAGKMKLDGPIMHAAADIAEQGAGEREIRGVNNRVLYSSAQGKVTDKIPEDDMPTPQSPGFVRRVISRLFGE